MRKSRNKMSKRLLTVIGLAVLDDIHFSDGKTVKDVRGGSAGFCKTAQSLQSASRVSWLTMIGSVGAHLVTSAEEAKSILWLIRVGWDFPEDVKKQIDTWSVNVVCEWLPAPTQSPRGLILYSDQTLAGMYCILRKTI